jgi:hypothetical protein
MIEQPGQFEQHKKSDIEEAAYDARMRKDVVLPKDGTGAYESLKKVCEDYSGVIAQETRSKSSSFIEISEKKRRALHAELCVKLYGTSWQETSPKDRDIARCFAHYVAGRPSFADDFTF